ncbi:histidinol-phosphatase HisJ [Metabacillus malikii]|uniref:Histidinol-phosphatase n=1 Tax=Metabacillus malikii TaxID=1504265 RepID=A0ABT9ZFN6_9BACI|nr:histidinol-phosphatase HisJ [Metabacillus malikii]MDQ0231059.1 histidinol-phosphatase (PHP family) [Metabacillus malikii]
MKMDGHIHTPYCPHGTKDSLKDYIEQAITENFTSITFTEHAPLPTSFTDPTPKKDSAIELDEIENYLRDLERVKQEYKNDISINIGLEVDYIQGFEHEITQFLNAYGKHLDDSILSVHFLKLAGQYYCMDYDEHVFSEMVQQAGTLHALHNLYYEEVYNSITSNLGVYKPKRIGHITLVRKFQKLFPITFSVNDWIEKILNAIKKENYELDFNVAGLRKEYCGEVYPDLTIAKAAQQQRIPLIYGSDAHSARDLGKNYTYYHQLTTDN